VDVVRADLRRYGFGSFTLTCRSRSVSPPAVVHTFALTLAPEGMESATTVPTRLRPRLFAFVTVNATLPLVALPLSSACSHLGFFGSLVVVVVCAAVSRFECFVGAASANDATSPATEDGGEECADPHREPPLARWDGTVYLD